MTFKKHSREAFTLIEVLVVVAIIAAAAVAVILTLNPTELLKQSRDSSRIADMNTLNTTLAIFSADQPGAFTGVSTVVYVSLPDSTTTCANLGLPALPAPYTYNCVSSSTLRNVDGTGWIPVNLTAITSFGGILHALPIDPSQSTSTGLYYAFDHSSIGWELTSVMESAKQQPIMSSDGGVSASAYEVGTDLSAEPAASLNRSVGNQNPVPTLASISPTSTAVSSGAFTLTLNGSNFVSSSVVYWGGSARSTTLVSSNQLTASISNSDISASGTVAVSVTTPTPGGGSSGSQNFAVVQYGASTWATDSSGGASQSWGATLADVGGKEYVLNGNGTGFQMYDPGGKTWTTKASTPQAVGTGAAIVKYNSNTIYALRGGSTTSFWKYTIGSDTWTQVASTTAAVGNGGSLVYPGSGDLIYAFFGLNPGAFNVYSVSHDSWLSNGISQGNGTTMLEVSGKIYLLDGNGSTGFHMYDPTTYAWTTKASMPLAPSYGAALVQYDSDTLYALRGGSTTSFFKYSISGDAWTQVASSTGNMSTGASLAYPSTGTFIYATQGGNAGGFYKYDAGGDVWASLSGPGSNAGGSGALVTWNTNTLYGMFSGYNAHFYQYNVASSTWTVKTSPPLSLNGFGPPTSDGTYLYVLRGSITPTFMRYNPANDTWSYLASTTVNMGQNSGSNQGGGIAYSSALNAIFAAPGESFTNVFDPIVRYDFSTGLWTPPGYGPQPNNSGGTSLASCDSDTIYALFANNATFYQYKISTGAWTQKTSAPASVMGGGALACDGTNVYAIRGGNTNTFWIYSPGANAWTVGSTMSLNEGISNSTTYGGMTYSSTLNSLFVIPGSGTSIVKNAFAAQ